MKSGIKTSEFTLSLIMALIGPVMTGLVAFGVFDIPADQIADKSLEIQAQLQTSLDAVIILVSNVMSVLAVGNYTKQRTLLKKSTGG